MESFIYAALVIVPAMLVLVPIQLLRLRAASRSTGLDAGAGVLTGFALLAVASGLAAGLTVGYLFWLGLSYWTGEFLILPWFTALPALGLGLWTVSKVAHAVARRLLDSRAR